MTNDIETLIDQRPHLKDPFALYGRWQRFEREVGQLLPKQHGATPQNDVRVYPRESIGPVVRLFATIFELPDGMLEPLSQAMENGDIDFMRFPLGELPTFPQRPASNEELGVLLYLLSRPYFLALQQRFLLNGNRWEDGRCPLCSARPALASIAEGPQRLLHCSFCGTFGPYRFIGCPNCGTEDVVHLNTILADDEPGFRLVTCDNCKTYIKVVDGSVLREMTADLADLASLPLDIIAQQKRFTRLSPNPIGLRTME